MAAKKAPSGDAPKAKSKKKLIIIVVAVLAIAGGAYKFVLAPKPAAAKAAAPVAGVIVNMQPTTLNLADGHYLKVGIAIQLVKGKTTETGFMAHAQELVINEFSGRQLASMTNGTRLKLMKDLGAGIKKAYPGEVFTIFVTQFVTQ